MRQTIEIVLNHPVVKRLHLADFLWSSSWSSDDDFFTLMVPQIFSHCWWDSKEASSWETIGYRPLVFHIGYLKMLFYSNKSPQVLTLNLFSFKSFATSVMKRRQVWNKARHGNWLRFVHHAIKFARERGWLPQKLPCADSLVVDDHPCRLFMFMTCDRCAFLLHLDDDELLYPEVRRGNSWRSRDTDGSPCQVLTPTQRWSEPGTFASSCSLPFEFWTKEFPHVVFVWIYRVVTACDVCTVKVPCLSWLFLSNRVHEQCVTQFFVASLNLTGGRRHPCTLREALEEFQKAHVLFSTLHLSKLKCLLFGACPWIAGSISPGYFEDLTHGVDRLCQTTSPCVASGVCTSTTSRLTLLCCAWW